MSFSGGQEAEVGAGDAAVSVMCSWTPHTALALEPNQDKEEGTARKLYLLLLRWYPGRQELLYSSTFFKA